MGKSKDLATGASYVDTSGDTMSGSLSVSTSGNSSMTLQTSSASNSVSTNFQSANRTYYAGVDIGGANSSFTVYDGTAGAERFKIDASGRVTMPNQPCFSASLGSSQSISSTTWSKINLNTEQLDKGNNFDTSNYRFVAPVAGSYFFTAKVNWEGGSSAGGGYLYMSIKVNNTTHWYLNGLRPDSGTNFESDTQLSGSEIVYLSANDYVELWTYAHWASSGNVYGSNRTRLSGFLIG